HQIIGYAEHVVLGGVRIAHETAVEPGGAAGNVGQALGDPAARAGFGSRDHQAASLQAFAQPCRERFGFHDRAMVPQSGQLRRRGVVTSMTAFRKNDSSCPWPCPPKKPLPTTPR